MKNIVAFLCCLACLKAVAQETKPAFDGHTWEAPYHLPIPTGWALERFQIPISFAPEIRYEGVEDIRFTPGWARIENEEYWTYAFLWYLDGSVKMDEKTLNENLTAYYRGLYKINTGDESAEKRAAVVASIHKSATGVNDIATFSGTITIMDYMQKKPILLYCMVHYRVCEIEKKTVLFYELSPKPFSHGNWTKLNQLWTDFSCKKS